MKAKDIKNKESKIELLDGVHNITIDFNTYDLLEEMYTDINIALSKFNGVVKINDIKKFLCCGINSCIENEDEHYTPFQIGKLIDEDKIAEYVNTLYLLIDKSSPEPKEENEDEDEDDEEENTKN